MRILASWLLIVAAACSGTDEPYAPNIEPAHFVTGVDNAYFPLVPGTVFDYAVTETGETVTVTVTGETRVVMGVTCVVVHDVASLNGRVIEDTYDWYAQDDQGTVWYFGEDTTAFDGDMTSKEGSWEAGVDGALPGVIIQGKPRVGDRYRQEYLVDEAEDEAEVLSLDASITVQYGSFTGCMQTRDFTRLQPEVEEHKYYCPDVGQVSAQATKGAPEHEDLISVTRP